MRFRVCRCNCPFNGIVLLYCAERSVAGVASVVPAATRTRKIKPERLAHLGQPKVLARQRQNYEGYGYGTALGYAEGYHPGLDGQR